MSIFYTSNGIASKNQQRDRILSKDETLKANDFIAKTSE